MVKDLLKKYKGLLLYLFFGVCTTGVNIVSYWVCSRFMNMNTVLSTVIAWLLAVLFAYVTNRIWVFESNATGFKRIMIELMSFITCRVATGIMDIGIMYLCVDMLGMNDVLIKALSNIIVIILNYIASKLFIFRKA